jgi:amidohydrolase
VSNVIPESVTMTGTVRSFSPETRTLLHEELEKAVRIVEVLGGSAELDIRFGYPPTVNHPDATETIISATSELLGAEKVVEAPRVMGAEDFSYMAQAAPGAFIFLGVKNPDWDRNYPVHRPDFRIDEDALPYGSASLAAAAVKWMERER